MSEQSFDSPRAAGKFILGLFLLFGFVGLFQWQADRLWFIWEVGTNPKVEKIDLTTFPKEKLPLIGGIGVVTYTGYAGTIYSDDYGPLNQNDLETTRTFYYPLLSGINERPQIIVKHHETQSGAFGWFAGTTDPKQLPKPGDKITVEGIIGLGTEKIPDSIEEWCVDCVLLESQAKPPQLKPTLILFTISGLGLLIGASLILGWIRLVRQYYTPQKSSTLEN